MTLSRMENISTRGPIGVAIQAAVDAASAHREKGSILDALTTQSALQGAVTLSDTVNRQLEQEIQKLQETNPEEGNLLERGRVIYYGQFRCDSDPFKWQETIQRWSPEEKRAFSTFTVRLLQLYATSTFHNYCRIQLPSATAESTITTHVMILMDELAIKVRARVEKFFKHLTSNASELEIQLTTLSSEITYKNSHHSINHVWMQRCMHNKEFVKTGTRKIELYRQWVAMHQGELATLILNQRNEISWDQFVEMIVKQAQAEGSPSVESNSLQELLEEEARAEAQKARKKQQQTSRAHDKSSATAHHHMTAQPEEATSTPASRKSISQSHFDPHFNNRKGVQQIPLRPDPSERSRAQFKPFTLERLHADLPVVLAPRVERWQQCRSEEEVRRFSDRRNNETIYRYAHMTADQLRRQIELHNPSGIALLLQDKKFRRYYAKSTEQGFLIQARLRTEDPWGILSIGLNPVNGLLVHVFLENDLIPQADNCKIGKTTIHSYLFRELETTTLDGAAAAAGGELLIPFKEHPQPGGHPIIEIQRHHPLTSSIPLFIHPLPQPN